jgi:hypothetical protein
MAGAGTKHEAQLPQAHDSSDSKIEKSLPKRAATLIQYIPTITAEKKQSIFATRSNPKYPGCNTCTRIHDAYMPQSHYHKQNVIMWLMGYFHAATLRSSRFRCKAR